LGEDLIEVSTMEINIIMGILPTEGKITEANKELLDY